MWKLLIVVAICLASSVAVVFKDCGSKGAKIESVNITPCKKEPCLLKHNTHVNVTVVFNADEVITSAKTKVYGVIAGIKVPFPMPDDACKNMTCPTIKGKTEPYSNSIFVLPSFPKLTLVVQWEVHGGNGDMLFCFEVPAQITD